MLNASKSYTIYTIELLQIIKEAKETFTYIFSKPTDLSWQEGAHTHLALDKFNEELGWFEKKDVRHFSIMTLADEQMVGITTRIPVVCTEFKKELKQAKVGDLFYLFKIGSRLVLRRDGKPIVLITSGVGIASVRPLVKAFYDDDTEIPWLYHINVDSSKEYLFKHEFEGYEKKSSFMNDYTGSRTEFYEHLERLFVLESFENRVNAHYYIIGSDEFLVQVRDVLIEHNISTDQMIVDKKDGFASLQP